MTKAELKRFVKFYKDLFPGWIDCDGEGFARISGPFVQQVWFENLRSGAYRPVSTTSLLIAKNGASLHQFLDIRHREVLPREHERKFAGILVAMQEQLIPSINSPLDETEIRKLFIEQSTGRLIDASSLAALSAYFGDFDDANKWIDVVKQFAQDRNDLWDWERELVNNSLALEEALLHGTVETYLNTIRESEIRRYDANRG